MFKLSRRGFLGALANLATLPYIEPIIKKIPIPRKFRPDYLPEQIVLTQIPPAPSGVVARRIYRTNGDGLYKLIATIPVDDQSPFTDDIADKSEQNSLK